MILMIPGIVLLLLGLLFFPLYGTPAALMAVAGVVFLLVGAAA